MSFVIHVSFCYPTLTCQYDMEMHNSFCIKCQFVDCTKERQQHWQLIYREKANHGVTKTSLTYLLIRQHTGKERAHTALNGVPFHGIACLEGLQWSPPLNLWKRSQKLKERFPLPWLCGWQNHPICKLGLGKLNNSSRVSWQCCPCRNIRRARIVQ